MYQSYLRCKRGAHTCSANTECASLVAPQAGNVFTSRSGPRHPAPTIHIRELRLDGAVAVPFCERVGIVSQSQVPFVSLLCLWTSEHGEHVLLTRTRMSSSLYVVYAFQLIVDNRLDRYVLRGCLRLSCTPVRLFYKGKV
jgi:hypothetical protein